LISGIIQKTLLVFFLQAEYVNFSLASIPIGQVEFKTAGDNNITFPPESEIEVGKSWHVTYNTKIKITCKDIETDADARVGMENNIISIESIEVPCGSYPEAIKIAGKVTVDIESAFGSKTFIFELTSRLVKDVGPAKQIIKLGKSTTIVELVSVGKNWSNI